MSKTKKNSDDYFRNGGEIDEALRNIFVKAKKDGDELFDYYRHLLEELRKKSGLLGLIFGRA